jgi:hypothetical protein
MMHRPVWPLLGGLTGSWGCRTAISRKNRNALKKKVRPSFKELLAKYKRKGVAKKQRNQPNGAKGVRASPRHEGIHHQ